MGIWIFMTLISLLIPFSMIFFGRYFKEGRPRKINNVVGYRTTMSMKNEDTWLFAHKYCGKLWIKIGTVMFFISLLLMLCFINSRKGFIENLGFILMLLQCGMLIFTVFPIEKALKKNFDKFGNRRL